MTQANRKPATVVLVHGAYHGAWCWRFVADLLHPRGVPTFAVNRWTNEDPPRVVSDPLENHRLVREALDKISGPIVLMGHSAAGAPITTAAAGHGRVRHLVYLAAIMPGGDVAPPDTFVAAARINYPDGSRSVDPRLAHSLFYGDCSAELAAWAIAQVRPQAPAGQSTPTFREPAWRIIPSTYVVCAGDRAIDPGGQRRLATQATEVVEWETSHSPFLSRPDMVADLLEKLALRYAE